MMGQQTRKESLFYYLRLEDQIPETHLLRLIDRYVDFSFVRDRLKDFYSPPGRPSIDPEVLLRLLFVGYLYGITGERRLLEDVRVPHPVSSTPEGEGLRDDRRFWRHCAIAFRGRPSSRRPRGGPRSRRRVMPEPFDEPLGVVALDELVDDPSRFG